MSQKICPNCLEPFKQGDKVRAEIVTSYVALKSKTTYALERPEECTHLEHYMCEFRMGEEELTW